MATTSTPRSMPRLLKATYLADQEYLLEETRATKLYYFPGPVLWTLFWGIVTYLTAAPLYNLPGAIAWPSALQNVANAVPSGDQKWVVVVFLLLFLFGFLWLLARYFRWIRTVYAVTSRRVIIQKGILGKDFDEIPVNQVRGVDVHQSFGQRILGYGTVRVSSEGGTRVGNEDWKGIPKPFRFQKIIENATIAATSPAPAPQQPPWPSPPR
jgi:membrane protein YdbS with pleckstrin-like domain